MMEGCLPSLYKSSEHQLPDDELSIGHDIQAFLKSQANLSLGAFFSDVRKYFTAAVEYMLSKFPCGDKFLRHDSSQEQNFPH